MSILYSYICVDAYVHTHIIPGQSWPSYVMMSYCLALSFSEPTSSRTVIPFRSDKLPPLPQPAGEMPETDFK